MPQFNFNSMLRLLVAIRSQLGQGNQKAFSLVAHEDKNKITQIGVISFV